METPAEGVSIISELGRGAFARVYLARRGNRYVAVKKLDISSHPRHHHRALLQRAAEELRLMQNLDHVNIVRCFGCERPEENNIHIYLEYCAGGDLQSYLRSNGAMDDATTRHFTRQLAAGLSHIWSMDAAHRDIKPSNLLLTESHRRATLKITDFGLARQFDPLEQVQTRCGTMLYMAPEVLSGQRYDGPKADIWSCGAVVYEMLTSHPPFEARNESELRDMIRQGQLTVPQGITVLPEASDLIRVCLRRNPTRRAGPEDFCNADFIQSLTPHERRPQPGATDAAQVRSQGEHQSAHHAPTEFGSLPADAEATLAYARDRRGTLTAESTPMDVRAIVEAYTEAVEATAASNGPYQHVMDELHQFIQSQVVISIINAYQDDPSVSQIIF